jgi:hypothetical protein
LALSNSHDLLSKLSQLVPEPADVLALRYCSLLQMRSRKDEPEHGIPKCSCACWLVGWLAWLARLARLARLAWLSRLACETRLARRRSRA